MATTRSFSTRAKSQSCDIVATMVNDITTKMGLLKMADSGTVDWEKWDDFSSMQLGLNNISDIFTAGSTTPANRERFYVRIAEIKAEFIFLVSHVSADPLKDNERVPKNVSFSFSALASQNLGISGKLDIALGAGGLLNWACNIWNVCTINFINLFFQVRLPLNLGPT